MKKEDLNLKNNSIHLIPLAIEILQTHKEGLYSENELMIVFNAIESLSSA